MFSWSGNPDLGGVNREEGHTVESDHLINRTPRQTQVDDAYLENGNLGTAYIGDDSLVKRPRNGNPRRPNIGNALLLDASYGQGLTSTSCSSNSLLVSSSIVSRRGSLSTSNG